MPLAKLLSDLGSVRYVLVGDERHHGVCAIIDLKMAVKCLVSWTQNN